MSTSTPVAAEPDGLRVTLGRTRLYETRHQLDLLLANDGPDPVPVDTIQLDSPYFAAVTAQPRSTIVLPGSAAVSMPLTFGEPRCGESSRDHRVMIGAGGTARSVPATVEPPDALDELWRRECEAQAVAESVDLAFTEEWSAIDSVTMTGQLDLHLRDTRRRFTLDEIRGSVIFAVEAGDDIPVAILDDRSPGAEVPVIMSAAGCTSHALIESKKTYVFTAYVTLDGHAATVPIEIPVTGRDPFDALLEPCTKKR